MYGSNEMSRKLDLTFSLKRKCSGLEQQYIKNMRLSGQTCQVINWLNFTENTSHHKVSIMSSTSAKLVLNCMMQFIGVLSYNKIHYLEQFLNH